MTEDVRVVKTKQNIEKTFLHLLSEHTFHKITVSMIVREAMINKGTFYRHYTDKYDLAYHVAEDTLDRFAELVYVDLDHLTSGTTQKDVMHTLINSFNDVLPSLIALQAIDIPNMDVRRSVVKIISDGIKAYAADRREAATWTSRWTCTATSWPFTRRRACSCPGSPTRTPRPRTSTPPPTGTFVCCLPPGPSATTRTAMPRSKRGSKP